jgi:AraC-like DNA-binding protein
MKNKSRLPQVIPEKNQTGDFKISTHDETASGDAPHTHDHYMIIFLRGGSSVHSIDFIEYNIEAPALIFIAAGQVHNHISSECSNVYTISFTSDFILSSSSTFLAHLFDTTVVRLNGAELNLLLPFADLLFKEYTSATQNQRVLGNLLMAFLEKCEYELHKYHSHDKEHYNNLFQNFMRLVNEHYTTKFKVSDYASLLYITPGHLNDVIKEVTGKNAKQFIDDRRVLEAKRLLYWTERSVKEIAWDLGFDDAAYFTRFFKKQTGELPTSFKRQVH